MTWHDGTEAYTVGCRHVLAGSRPGCSRCCWAAPRTDDQAGGLAGAAHHAARATAAPEARCGPGSGVRRLLPRRAVLPGADGAYDVAAGGRLPEPPPGTISCPSLTDPTVLGDLAGTGAHTLTYAGILAPATLFAEQPSAAKAHVISRAVAALDEHLAEPLAPAWPATRTAPVHRGDDPAGPRGTAGHARRAHLPRRPGLALGPEPGPARDAAQQWGVQTDIDAVLLCGAGARRGGGVSGIPGHNAAQAVLAVR